MTPGPVDRDRDLFGIVVDDTGRPVITATIEALDRPERGRTVSASRARETRTVATTQSTDDGTFALRLTRGQEVDLQVTAPGHARTALFSLQAGTQVKVVLLPPSRLEVLVQDPSGEPIEGAIVSLRNRRPTGGISTFPEQQVLTGANGLAIFADLPAGPAEIQAFHDQRARPRSEKVTIPQGETRRVDIVMNVGRTITGHVIDARGDPIEGARVGVSGWPDRFVSTDARGSYELPGWSSLDGVRVRVSSEVHGSQEKRVPDSGPLDFQLSASLRVVGRIVRASDQAPLPDVEIAALALRFPPWPVSDERFGISDEDGSFEITALRPDLRYTLVIQEPGFARSLLDIEAPNAIDGTIQVGTVTLRPGRRIEGRVVDETGTAWPHQPVTVKGSSPERYRLRAPGTRSQFDEIRRVTDDLGRFRFRDLAPGHYRVSARIEGRPIVFTDVELTGDGDLIGVELATQGGIALHVHVREPSGTPVPDASIRARSGRISIGARTDEEGNATLIGLPAASAEITVTADGFVNPDRRLVTAGGQTETYVLVPEVRLRGTVFDPFGEPLGGMQIEAHHENGTRTLFASARGNFSVRVPAREYIQLRLTGHRKRRDDLGHLIREVTDYRAELPDVTGPREDLELHARLIEYDRTITVRVLGPDDAPLAGIPILVEGSGLEPPGRRVTGADGRLQIEQLPSETIVITPRRPRLRPLPEDWVTPSAAPVVPDAQELLFRFEQGAVVRGLVVSQDGPVRGADLMITVADRDPLELESDGQGRFRFALPAGASADIDVMRRSRSGILRGGKRGVVASSSEVEIFLEP